MVLYYRYFCTMASLGPRRPCDMLPLVVVALLASASARAVLEPRFQVLTPNELVVEVPQYEDLKLVTLRIGVRREGRDEDDLELGENTVDDDRVFIYDQRLNLRKGDVVNYLLVFKKKTSYRVHVGEYEFNGAYYKKPFSRRLRRDAATTTAPEKSQDNTDDAEEFNPVEPRFGGGHHPRGHHFPHHHNHGGFNPWGPRQPHPNFPPGGGPPPFGPPPNFGSGCNDHRHDMCHGRDTERWRSSTEETASGVEYHCRMCENYRGSRSPDVTTRRTTTTTEEDLPDIDIRFSD